MKSKACRFVLSLLNFKPYSKTYSSATSCALETRRAHGHAYDLLTSAASEAGGDRSNFACRTISDEVLGWDVVSATAEISRIARLHRHGEAIFLFSRMLLLDIRPNNFTFGAVLHSSIVLRDLNAGKQLHACAAKTGLRSNVFVGSALVDLYAKLGTVEEAERAFGDTREANIVSYTTLITGYLKKERIEDAFHLFGQMPERNVVSWNAMIGGCSQNGHNEEAVNLFVEMWKKGVAPNESTFPCVFSAAANIAALGIGKSLHACAVKSLAGLDIYVGNSLVSFYVKCGCMKDGLLVFNELPKRNTVSWNALICGYAQNGRAGEALFFFEQMQATGLRPNDVTLLGLLLACNHAGFVHVGYSYFNKAKAEDPALLKPEHYACMIDLLSRSGHFEEAWSFISNLPFHPGVGFWKALLGGCHIHSNTELGDFAARQIWALDPNDVSSYVMLSNAHSAAGKWQDAITVRKEMKERNMKKIPGCSWIEIRNKVSVFFSRYVKHDQRDEIYEVLGSCIAHMRDLEAQF